jgi:hypothetical protein
MSDVSERPGARAIIAEVLPLVDAVPFYGPPTVFLAVPWLFFALLLVGPFALLITLAIALLAAGVLIAAVAALAASPYLLVRHLRSAHRVGAPTAAERSPMPEPASAAGY